MTSTTTGRHISIEEAAQWFPNFLLGPNDPLPPYAPYQAPPAPMECGGTESSLQDDSPISSPSYQRVDYQPPHELFRIIRVVGSGVSGTAFLVEQAHQQLPNDGSTKPTRFIAKITDLSKMNDRKKAYAMMEIQCLAVCDHFSIIRHHYHATTPENSKILLIMEYADAGDLSRQIKHRAKEKSYFKEHEVAFLFLQMVLAIHYIHEKRMLHRDIKSANIFLMSRGITKVGDFGFSQVYEDTVSGEVAGTFCGTPYYLAPELWRRQRYSKKADVWALGVVLYETLALKRPFVADTMLHLMDRVMGGAYESIPPEFSDGMRDLVGRMLQFDPDARPSTHQILAHPYMVQTINQFETTVRKLMSGPEQGRILYHLAIGKEVALSQVPIEVPLSSPAKTMQHRGVITRLGSQGWKKRFLVLGGGELTISVVEHSVGETKAIPLKYILDVFPVSPQDAHNREFCFSLVLPNGAQQLFQAASQAECLEWITKLQDAISVLSPQ